MKSLGCQTTYCPISSGPRFDLYCRNDEARGVLGKIIEWFLKASCGCSKPGHGGGICPSDMPAPAPVGDGLDSGKNRGCGLRHGELFWENWTTRENWTGAKRLWTAVLHLRKKGALRGQNQAGQRHEVDGGGRRPRCSSGRSTYLGIARRSDLGGKHPGNRCSSALWSWPSQTKTAALDRRPSLRQRFDASSVEVSKNRVGLSAPQRSPSPRRAGWSGFEALSQALENRTHLCLDRKLPPFGCSL